MSTEQDFNQIRNYIIKALPELLRQPEIVTIIENIVAQQFVRHDEFTQVLHEIKLLREDMQLRFEQQQQEMDRRFEQVNKHLEQQQQEMDRRFNEQQEEMNRRFDEQQQETNYRFEQVDKRFDQQQQETNHRFDEQQKEMDRRFDEQHHDTLDIKRRVIKLESNMELVKDKITGFDAWLRVIAGNIGTEKGQNLEELFALGLSYGLKNREILPETIQLRQTFMDNDCLIYAKKWKSIEVDIIAENGKLTVFEVKATAVEMDVAIFAKKVELIQRQNPDKQVQGILISLGAKDEVKEYCAEYDIELLD